MQLKDLNITLPLHHDPETPIWTLEELINELQQALAMHGNIPVVVTGYEMGMDELNKLEIVDCFTGGGGCCGTFEETDTFSPNKKSFKALHIPR